HLLDACAALAETLLKACSKLSILATSREALNMAGERSWRVPSLLQLDPQKLPNEEKELSSVLMKYDAVRLFVDRAKGQRPEFGLNRQNAAAVAQVCHQLDGIPLAIE